MLTEGVNEKGALKFVFLAGGPGTGKNYVASQLFGIQKGSSFGAQGMKLISFDAIFEQMLKKSGANLDVLDSPYKEDWDRYMNPANPKSLYSKCRQLVKAQLKACIKEGTGVIFDGTGQIVHSYTDKKYQAEDMGYDTFLLVVDAPLEVALERNATRARRLPDSVVGQIHRAVKRNKEDFAKIFGKNMMVVQNDDKLHVTPEVTAVVNEILHGPVKNKIGQEFKKTGKRPVPPKPAPFTPPHGGYSTIKIYPKNSQGKSYGHGGYDNPDQFNWWKKFDEPKKPKDTPKEPTGHTSDLPNQEFIHNPETGNDILVKSALNYPPNHPMRKAAEQIKKK